MKKLLRQAAELVFPRRCPFCGEVIGFGGCEECAPYVEKVTRLDASIPVPGEPDGVEFAAAPYWYEEPARSAVLAMKSAESRETARAMADAMYDVFCRFDAFRGASAIVPVPSSRGELRERGYSVPLWLAQFLSQRTGLPVRTDILVKVRETARQMALPGHDRRTNLKNAFSCPNPDAVRGLSIVLIDDVYTTGSTMRECSRALKQAGAARCLALTVTVTK